MFRRTLYAIAFMCLSSVAAAADDVDDVVITAPAAAPASHRPLVPVTWHPVAVRPARNAQRPAALPVLYGSLASLQLFDGYSTTRALAQGAQEANPVMRNIVGKPLAFWSVKAAMAVAPMLMTERLWKKNKAGAIALMVASNGVMAMVAAQNARVLNRQR